MNARNLTRNLRARRRWRHSKISRRVAGTGHLGKLLNATCADIATTGRKRVQRMLSKLFAGETHGGSLSPADRSGYPL